MKKIASLKKFAVAKSRKNTSHVFIGYACHGLHHDIKNMLYNYMEVGKFDISCETTKKNFFKNMHDPMTHVVMLYSTKPATVNVANAIHTTEAIDTSYHDNTRTGTKLKKKSNMLYYLHQFSILKKLQVQ